MRLHETEIVDTYAEAFQMWAARIVITADSPKWALAAGRAMTGFATSVIGCKCEAGIERALAARPRFITNVSDSVYDRLDAAFAAGSDADLFDTEHVSPDFHQSLLIWGAWRDVDLARRQARLIGIWQSPAIDLAVGRARHLVKGHKDRRHHVIRQLLS